MENDNIRHPYKAGYEAQQRALDTVARLAEPEHWSWNGEAAVEVSGRSIAGPTSLQVQGSSISGNTTWAGTAATFSHRFASYNPGKMRKISDLGGARPTQEDPSSWIAEGVREGRTRSSMGEPDSTDYIIYKLKVRGSSNQRPVVHRTLLRGIKMELWPHPSYWKQENFGYGFTSDRIDTTIFGREAVIRQITKSEKQEEQVIGVLVQGDPLPEREEHVACLLIDFLAGNRSHIFAKDSFDIDGSLVERVWFGSIQSNFTRFTSHPLDIQSTDSLRPHDFRDLLIALSAQIERGMPMAIALQHLSDAATNYLVSDIFFLTLTIHALFEAHAKLGGTERLIPKAEYRKRIKSIIAQIISTFESDHPKVSESVKVKLQSANRKDARDLRDEFFGSLNLALTDFEREALNERNHLFHNGYLKVRHNMSEGDIFQFHYDEACALRNLANRSILRLLNYQGNIQDCLTYRTQSIFKGSTVRNPTWLNQADRSLDPANRQA